MTASTLLSLPDDVIFQIITFLSPSRSATLSSTSLCTTCRRLNILHRLHISSLTLTQPHPPSSCRTTLSRHPNLSTLTLETSSQTWLDPRAWLSHPSITTLNIRNARLNSTIDLGTGWRVADATFFSPIDFLANLPSLTALTLHSCAPALGDVDFGHIATKTSATLQHLSLHRSAGRVTDLSAPLLASLTALTALDLAWCTGVGPRTFTALRSLSSLIFLNLAQTHLTDATAASFLPSLTRLVSLDVSRCAGLSPAVIAHLPTSLRTLKARGPHVLCDDVPAGALERLDLHEIHASCASGLSGWSALSGALARLEVLDVSWSGVGDVDVDILRSAGRLRRLDVTRCRKVSDVLLGTLRQSVKILECGRTNITAAGARRMGSNRQLRVIGLEGVEGGF